MSKSSKRILITGGCSFTEETYYHQFGVTAWPRIIADSMDLELVNVGRGGDNNDAIGNRVIDAAIEYKDRDPIVMVLWTEHTRANRYDYRSYFFEERDVGGLWVFPPIQQEEWGESIFNYTLRKQWQTKKTIEDMGLQYFHWIGLHNAMKVINLVCEEFDHPQKPAFEYNRILKKIVKSHYFKELNWPLRLWEMGLIHDQLECGHPNQEGHEQITEIFLNQYVESMSPKQDFVYD